MYEGVGQQRGDITEQPSSSSVFIFKFKTLFLEVVLTLCVHMQVCEHVYQCVCTTAYVRRSEDNLQDLVLSFSTSNVGSTDGTLVTGFGDNAIIY